MSRSVRLSDRTVNLIEALGKLGDTFDSVIYRLASSTNRDADYVRSNEDVREVFEAMRINSFHEDPEASFLLHLHAMDVPYQSYELVNTFTTILRGCVGMSPDKHESKLRASVLELIVDEGDVKVHGYAINPIHYHGWFSNMGVGEQSYLFLNSFTSGYGGTGPDMQRLVQMEIDKHKDSIRHTRKMVNSLKSMSGLFYERGPVVSVHFPNFEIPLHGFDYDTRFVRREED